MGFGGRGFAGGLAGGMVTGYKLGMEMDEAEERRKNNEQTRQLRDQEIQRGQREIDYERGKRAILDKYTTQDGQVEDAAGNVTSGRVARTEPLSLSEQIEMNRALAGHDFSYGKMSQADFMQIPKRLDTYRKEGVFDALDEMARTGDPEAGIKKFNSLGGTKIKAFTTRQVRDAVTGLPTTEFTVRTDDDNHQTFNLADMARSVGGIDKYIEWAKLGESARTRATAERKNDLIEQRNDQQFQLGMERSDREGRRLEALISGVIGGRRGGADGRQSVFQQRLAAYSDAIASQFPDLSESEVHRRALAATDKIRGDVDINRVMSIAKDLLKNGNARTLDDAFDSALRTAQRGSNAVNPRPGTSQPSAASSQKYTASSPARPVTQADFDALPPGSVFVNPRDGKMRTKN